MDDFATTLKPSKKTTSKKQPHINSRAGGLGPGITKVEAEEILEAEVKAVLHHRECISRFSDPYVQAALVKRNPGIEKFIPTDESTLFENYAVPIDRDATGEMDKYIAKLPGDINISMDGATLLSKQKVSIIV